MRVVWDISPVISSDTPTFPGDTPYSQRWVSRIGDASPVNVSAMAMSPHVGAHADAPLHYGADAAAIGCRGPRSLPWPLPRDSRHRSGAARDTGAPESCGQRSAGEGADAHLRNGADSLDGRLRRTRTRDDRLARPARRRLVGIDTPSVDPADSKTLDSHQQLLAHDMRVLENLVLDEIEPGDYELIALPLKLATRRCLTRTRGAAVACR